MKKFSSISFIISLGSLLCFLILGSNSLSAQQSFVFEEANPEFREGIELFQKEKYLAAQENFANTLKSSLNKKSELRIDAQYYHALCAVKLFHDDAATLLKQFIQDNPENNHLTSAYFNLANYQFRRKDFDEVISILSQIDPLDLKKEEKAEYYFKLGYAYFQEDQKEAAAQKFYEIKDTDNPYVSAARYYYAHISYEDGKYQTALEDFLKITKDPQFGPVVPYYITQIYYQQKKYADLLDYAPAVLDSAPPKREVEIKRLIGDAYYETEAYQEAVPYLEEYLLRRNGEQKDQYQMGYAYLKAGQYEAAKKAFQKSIGDNDSLNQSAYYFVATAALKTDDKSAAKNAFKFAADYDQDPSLQEDAWFNYAKLAYELSYHPYDDAILAFEDFIDKYPKSDKLDNAYEYLLGVYYTTRNYEEALKSIDRIGSQDLRLKEAKQRIAYYRGIELFNEENYQEAVELFNTSLKNNFDPIIKAKATYWLAESFHKLGDYDNAIGYYTDFLSSSGSRSVSYFERAYYNLAYSHYEKGKYASAAFWFKEYIDKGDQKYRGLINDSYLRIGDSYYVSKEYRKAIEAYDKAVRLNIANTDYSLLQMAISQGLLGEYKNKAQSLRKLINDQPASIYTDDALNELGKTLLVLNLDEDALAYYNQLITDYPKSPFLSEAYLKIGLIHYNREEDDLALNAFDHVIENYPSSRSAKEALDKVRKIFIDKGDLQAFEDYMNGVPFADVSKAKLDSTAYVIAENHYLNGNCEKAVRDLSNYLKRYPNGLFSLNARYYRAECENKQGFQQEALIDYQYVVDRETNKFTERSLASLGRIYQSMDSLEKAITAYEALMGIAENQKLIRSAEEELFTLYFQSEKKDKAKKLGTDLLERKPIKPGIWQEVNLLLAKINFEEEHYAEALSYLDSLAKSSSEKGAEAKYLKARIYYLQGLIDQSDTIIYQLVDQVPSQPYWIAKGFILLADNFIARDDLYNARITFQSVIDNADNQELIEIAQEKLAILEKTKSEEETESEDQSEPIEIDLSNDQLEGLEDNTSSAEEGDSLMQKDTIKVQPPKMQEDSSIVQPENDAEDE